MQLHLTADKDAGWFRNSFSQGSAWISGGAKGFEYNICLEPPISGLLGGLLFLPQGVANSLLLRIVVGSRLVLSLSNNACGFEPFALPANHADAVHSHLSPCFLAFSAFSPSR